MDMLIGGIAGAGATMFSNPMDVVKTRLQLQGELRSYEENKRTAHYRNVFHAMYVIARTDGPLALQQGLGPAMLLGFVLNSVRLGIYHMAEDNGWTKDDNGEVCLYKSSFWSCLAGALGGMVCNPIYIVKTRMQAMSHPSIAVGRQHIYNGAVDAVFKIYKTEGVKGFFGGAKATVISRAAGGVCQLTTFSVAKQALLKRGIAKDSPIKLAFLASLLSGMMVAVICCPLDVITVRLYNQGSTNKLYSTSILGSFIKIYRIEGIHGLYKGLVPRYIRVAPHTTATLVIWDALYGFLYPDFGTSKKKKFDVLLLFSL